MYQRRRFLRARLSPIHFVVDTFQAAWASLTRDPNALMRAVLVPVLALIPITVVQLGVVAGGIAWWQAIAVSCVLYAVLATNIHRLILLNKTGTPPLLPPFSATFGFALWALLTGLLASLIMLIPGIPLAFLASFFGGAAAFVFTGLLMLIFCYVMARLSLILPDRAIGQSHTLSENIDWSKDNGVQLALALFVAPFLASALIGGLEHVLPNHIALSALIGVANTVVLVVEIALLSVAYQALGPESSEDLSDISPVA